MITRIAEACIVGCMTLAGLGAGSLVGDYIEKDTVGMRLISIEYEDGMVTQSHRVFGSDIIQATWAANVTRGRRYVCSGGGFGIYEQDSVLTMSLDEWVGDDCPELEKGDKLKASWEWSGDDGIRYQVSGMVVVSD